MSITNLEHLQRLFQAAVLNNTQGITTQFKKQGRVHPGMGLEIYQTAYRLRLLETLRDTYAHTALYLGDSWFDSLGMQFIEEHPSVSHNIGLFGAPFSTFLRMQHPSDPDVHELALLDWHLRRAFDGPDSDTLNVDALTTISVNAWDGVVFHFVPTLQCHTLQSNVVAIWQALNDLQTPPGVELFKQPVPVLTWRKEFQPHFKTLTLEEFRVFELTRTQEEFGNVCQQVATDFPDSDTTALVGRCLLDWFQQGLISQISVSL